MTEVSFLTNLSRVVALIIIVCRFASFGWRELNIGDNMKEVFLSWEIRVKGNLTERPDIGRINSSPTAALVPNIKLLQGCNDTIRIKGM